MKVGLLEAGRVGVPMTWNISNHAIYPSKDGLWNFMRAIFSTRVGDQPRSKE